ncbi:MAG: glucose-1-phosphate cytidylyltransferase [Actinobacteria bacterium]|nr:glucose-1-phosphate cytidylyltransferase [Actinomycetota bacterium]MCI0544479.1 glucose-1-phosphate cytidylyltransferase [Actinomycetota bacterium]MCI0677527.1 glucose-1-phosphate cytidylyltransferase [Actinomycetota bacterium]
MKVAILAGGQGTRLAEETEVRPKPMVEIGGHPILWHIMKHYRHYGHGEFLIALGYKGEYIKKFFADYHLTSRNMRIRLHSGEIDVYGDGPVEDWTIDLIDTGRATETGGRIKRLIEHLDDTFFLTWGDSVSDVDLDALLAFHRSHGRLVTVTAVHPPPRYGQLVVEGDTVVEFSEKPLEKGWINGGFFVVEPDVADYIAGDETQWERQPMETLAAKGELMAYRHEGFWHPMDTLREKVILQRLWDSGSPPWRIWS